MKNVPFKGFPERVPKTCPKHALFNETFGPRSLAETDVVGRSKLIFGGYVTPTS